MDELVEAVLTRSGTLEALEAERTIEARGRIENLEELVGVAREFRAEREEPTLVVVPAGDLALLRPGRARRRGVARDADDDPQREGARVPRRLRRRGRGGDLPARALDRGQRDRGGAPALLRRHDAREGEADAHARDVALALRPARVQPRPRASSTSCPATSSASGCGRPRGGLRHRAQTRGARADRASRHIPSLPTGDSVRHGTLGEGVVTRIEPGGVVTVRFAKTAASAS